MKTYLEGSKIETTTIGDTRIPRLIMGIHPYDGCSYQNAETDEINFKTFKQVNRVTQVLRYAVEEAGITAAQIDHMLPQLDRLHLQAIWETEQLTNTQIGLIAYILIPITLDGELVAYSNRAHSTFYAHNENLGGQAFCDKIRQDAIVGYNLGGDALVSPATVPPYTAAEAARFEIDYDILEG